jgi:hypothetical protein
MPARKKATHKRPARKAASSRKAATLGRLERLERGLPPTLREFSQIVRGQLSRLERELTRQQVVYRRQAAHLLREASISLGRIEAEGEASWKRLTRPARRELLRLLDRLQKAIEPTVKTARARVRRVAREAKKVRTQVEKAAAEAAAAVTGGGA